MAATAAAQAAAKAAIPAPPVPKAVEVAVEVEAEAEAELMWEMGKTDALLLVEALGPMGAAVARDVWTLRYPPYQAQRAWPVTGLIVRGPRRRRAGGRAALPRS
jgi:hypothetical protein